MSSIPTGTVTFLFTDIEGSTKSWERQPRAMTGAGAFLDTLKSYLQDGQLLLVLCKQLFANEDGKQVTQYLFALLRKVSYIFDPDVGS